MICPNINTPEWKSLVDKIGENNAYREFYSHGYIPSADNYNVLEKGEETVVKPGVSELFESDSNFASEIYEALGFKLPKKDTVRLYRIENKNIPYDESREGIVSKKEIVGGFFTDSVDTVVNYIRKNQSQEGINLVYVDILKSDLDKYHVSKNEYAKDMDVESDNWIIPSDINRSYVDLSSVSKVTGNFMTLSKAKQELKSIIDNLPTSQIAPQQKQQALEAYSQYLEQTGKQDVEGFKEFVGGKQETPVKKDVLYSIRTKSLEELSKGINPDLIRSAEQIKYSGFIKTMVLTNVGDIAPGKKLEMSPETAFKIAKEEFVEIQNKLAITLNDIITSQEDYEEIVKRDDYDQILEAVDILKGVTSYEDLKKAASIYTNIVENFDKYIDFVKIDLAHNGIKIVKNKFKTTDVKDISDTDSDNNEDSAEISQREIGERHGKDSFEINPRDTASLRVKSLIQTIFTGEFEFGIPLYADPNDVFADILDAGSSINLSGYTETDSKYNAFIAKLTELAASRKYLENLKTKIEKFKENNQWEKINDILTVATKAYSVETLLLYKLLKSGSDTLGVTDTKVITTNRDSIDLQISKEWLFSHVTSDFYKKDGLGNLLPKQEKIDRLKAIVEEGKDKDEAVQFNKFKEFFDELGLHFSDEEVKEFQSKLHKVLKKGSFNLFFQNNNLLNNIITSFERNINEPFIGQYGFQDETTSMKQMAMLYYAVNPGKYKITSTKTADGKSKYSYIQPSYVERIKRDWKNGNTGFLVNSALAKPNAQKSTAFWSKVRLGQAKFELNYFNGIREQKKSTKGKVRKSLTPKEQIVSMFLLHQQNINVGTYVSFTLSDKTTNMETRMTKEFFVDADGTPVGSTVDYNLVDGKIVYTKALKNRIYNAFAEPEISRILASIKNTGTVNVENFEIASKLFYFFPNLNRNENLKEFRDDLYSGNLTIEQLSAKYSEKVGEAILNELSVSADIQIDELVSLGVINIDKNGNYSYPLFINGYKESDYVQKFRSTNVTGRNMATLMVMDLKLNYYNSLIKTIQFLKFDPATAFKSDKSIKLTDKTISDLTSDEKLSIANLTWDEFSKRAAGLIAPGSQGNWLWNVGGKPYEEAAKNYITVTAKDVKVEVKNTNGDPLNESETTDAEELVTMQEHIDYLMHEGKIDYSTWLSIYNKIKDAGPGGYYTLSDKELGLVVSPVKPVYFNYENVGDQSSGLNRIDYVKSSRYPLIPQHEAGSERDKLRIWMEKNNVRSVNFASGKKLGRPTKSLVLFDNDNNFIEPSDADFQSSKQELSRSGLRNQQELPEQKDKIATITQMNRTLFDGLLEVNDFTFGNMKDVSGNTGKQLKEAVRSKLFDMHAARLKERLGDLSKNHVGIHNLLKDIIVNDTTGTYTENDLHAIELDPKTKKFKIPLEAQWKLPKFQSLINSLIDKNVMLKVEGTSFVQVSGVGTKFTFSKVSKGVKSDIIWIDKHAEEFSKDGATLKYIRQEDGKTKAAQVIVSQYLRDEDGELIDLSNFIKEDEYGRKILDTSSFSEKMFQLIGSRIPNQSHPSTLPIEVVGFLPAYMENSIIVPDGITGQMGSDFDVDKLYAYVTKFKYNKEKEDERLGADENEYNELVSAARKKAKAAGEESDKNGIFKNFNKYLYEAVKDKYGDAEPPKYKFKVPESIKPVTYTLNSLEDVNKLTEDQLNQLYRDIHWEVLMNPAAFEKITKVIDMPEVKSKVEQRNEQLKKYGLDETIKVNLPLDFMTSINRYIDNRSGKVGVGVFANLISAQADFQDKIIKLADEDDTPNPIQIKNSKNSAVTNLMYVGQSGESTSFLNKKRSISDNLNIMFTESVDNAKNQFLREFNWSEKAMSAVGFFAMLSDKNGNAAPIEFMMDLTSQPIIGNLFNLIDQKQDSFGSYDSNAILNAATELENTIVKTIDEKKILPSGQTALSYFDRSNKTRESVIDAESLAESWIIGQAIKQKASDDVFKKLAEDFKYKSVNDMLLNHYNTQYNALDVFLRLESLGRELQTILGSSYTYTKGIGPNVFTTKQKLNQLNKLAASTSFSDMANIAGEVMTDDITGEVSIIPKGEIGSSIENSLIFAQDVYKELFPISSGEHIERIASLFLNNQGLSKQDLSKSEYENLYSTIFYSIISYVYTNPEFELFDNVLQLRTNLINGKTSIGYRVIELKKDPKYAKNGFLKYIEAEKDFKSDAYTISFKNPFGTEINSKEIASGFYQLALDENDDIKQLAKDFALYPYATGDAGYIGRYIPVGYYNSDKDFNKAMENFEKIYTDHVSSYDSIKILIDQIVQNNPEQFASKFSFSTNNTQQGVFDNVFKKILKKAVDKDSLKDVQTFKINISNIEENDKNKGILQALKVDLTDVEIEYISSKGYLNTGFKYPAYMLINDQKFYDFDGMPNTSVSYLYKRISDIGSEDGVATYKRIEILGHDNISEFDFNNPDLISSIPLNNVSRDEKLEIAEDKQVSQPTKKQTVETTDNNPKNYTNHSGGAALSDTEWDQIGREFGVTNHIHYREPLEYIDTKGQPAKGSETLDSKKLQAAGIKPTNITQEDYNEGAKKATAAFRMMFEDAGNKSVRQAYIIRNWMQVKNADAIYALGTIRQPGENASDKAGETRIAAIPIVKGGTGYAVQMAINEGKPVYVFDATKEGWYKYDYTTKNFVTTETPTLTKNFAGIGSRSLATQEVIDKSLQAIRDVYTKTFATSNKTSNQIYSELGNKTQSENVEIPGKGDLKDVTYNAKTFWSEVVPEARAWFGDKLIIAYRGKKTNTFLQNYKGKLSGEPALTIGNPFDYAVEQGSRKKQGITSTKKFIEWMITGNNFGVPKATEEYRQAIIEDIKNGTLKNRPIIYYQEKDYATHATALDYLINKYDWNKPTANVGVEISSNSKGLAAALTNPTELAKSKGNLTQSYPVEFEAVEYKDAEAAYQAMKKYATKDEGPKSTYNLMVKIITAKLQQHPRLVIEIDKQGGSEWILSSTHQPTNKNTVWETGGKNWFIKALNEAYLNVKQENINVNAANTQEETSEEQEEQPEIKSAVVEYGGKNYIVEGTMEDGYSVFFQAKGEKGKPVTDSSLKNKVILTHEVSLHPEWVVTLTNIQGNPKYFVNIEGGIQSLQKTSFGDYIQSKDIAKRVMSLYNDKKEIEPEIIENKNINLGDDEYRDKQLPDDLNIINSKITTDSWSYDEKTKSWKSMSGTVVGYRKGQDGYGFPALFLKIKLDDPTHKNYYTTIMHYGSYWTKFTWNVDEQLKKGYDKYKNELQSQSNKKEITKTLEETTTEPTPVIEETPIKKEKRINVPKGSNPNNNVILETDDTIYLMNDGQQEAYDFIKGEVEKLLANKKRITEADLNKTVIFDTPLTKQFSGIIPQDMWDNMIGLAGRGGVGKTTVIKAIMAAIEGKNKYSKPDIMYLTPTHTAATVLQESLGLDSEYANDGIVNTIAAQVRRNKMVDGVLSLVNEKEYVKSTQFKPAMGSPDIIIIDESSMIGKKDMSDIILRLKEDLRNGLISKMPVFIFMGDYRQLGPIGEQQSPDVNKGLISSTLLLDKSKTKELTQVMRSDSEGLHRMYDAVGSEIVKNINNLNSNLPAEKLSFDKYDKLTNQSTQDMLVVTNENGVIDDYTDYLINNNNPYGMFWVHYNNVEHANTKNIASKIRSTYFKKLGLDSSTPAHRLYASQDYVIFDGKIEIGTSDFEYTPSNDKLEKILSKQKYQVKDGKYKITKGAIKPGSRFKVLDVFSNIESIESYASPMLMRYLNKGTKVEIEHTILYNRQDKVRHIHKILGFEISGERNPKTGEITYGKYNTTTRRQEGIQIKNIKTGEIIAKFDLSYGDYIKLKPELDELNEKYTPPYVPSYVGSSHTAQGNSIKNVIVGDYNIKKNMASNVNQDDIFSSMYVALTRTSGRLIVIKPAGSNIVNNQEVFLGAITDTNNSTPLPKSSTTTSEIIEIEQEQEDEVLNFDDLFMSQMIKSSRNEAITNIFGADKKADVKSILNNLYKETSIPFYKQILSLIYQTGGVSDLKIIIDNTMGNPGSYNLFEKTIRINPDLAFESDPNNANALQDVLVHELMHHVVANIIDSDKSKLTPAQRKWVISLENLFKSTQEKILNDPQHGEKLRNAIAEVNKEDGFLSMYDKSMYYGLTNIHDFVSMLMTDKDFRNFMNNVKFNGEKSIIDRFIELLANIFKELGLVVNDDSVLKEGITNIIGIMENRNTELKSIATKPFLDNMVDNDFEDMIKKLNIEKTNCK